MAGALLKTSLRMAAPAAILILLPGVAAAEVCDKSTTFLASMFPALEQWVDASPQGEQLRQLLVPSTWVTAALLIWLIASNGTRATMIAATWFACLALYNALLYFSIDLSDPYYQVAIREGCVQNSPYRIFTNLAFAGVAVLLTWQRMRRQKLG